MKHTLIIALLGFALLLTFGLATQSLPSGQFAQLDSGTGETHTPPPSTDTSTKSNDTDTKSTDTTTGSSNTSNTTTNTGSSSTGSTGASTGSGGTSNTTVTTDPFGLDSGDGDVYVPPSTSGSSSGSSTTGSGASSGSSTNTTSNTTNTTTNTSTSSSGATNSGAPLPGPDTTGIDSGTGEVAYPPQETERERLERLRSECSPDPAGIEHGLACDSELAKFCGKHGTEIENVELCRNVSLPSQAPVDSLENREYLEQLRQSCSPPDESGLVFCDQTLEQYCEQNGADPANADLCSGVAIPDYELGIFRNAVPQNTTSSHTKGGAPVNDGTDPYDSASGFNPLDATSSQTAQNTDTTQTEDQTTVATTTTDPCAGLNFLAKFLCNLPGGAGSNNNGNNNNGNSDNTNDSTISISISTSSSGSSSDSSSSSGSSSGSSGGSSGTQQAPTTTSGSSSSSGSGSTGATSNTTGVSNTSNTSGGTSGSSASSGAGAQPTTGSGSGSTGGTKITSAIPLPEDDGFGAGTGGAGGTQQAVRVVDVQIVDESQFVEAPPTSGSAQTENQQIAPEPHVSFNQNYNDLHGEVKLFVRVAGASGVEVMLRKPGTLASTFLTKLKRSGGDTFTAVWNTANSPNGAYQLQLVIDNEFGEYKSQLRTVAIRNIAALADAQSTKTVIIGKIASPTQSSLTDTDRTELDERLTEVIRLTSIRGEVEAQNPTDFTRQQLALNLSQRVQEFEDAALEKVIRTTLALGSTDDQVNAARTQLQTRKGDLVQKPNRSIVYERLAQSSRNQTSIFRAQLLQSPELLEEKRVVEAISAIVDVDNDGLSNEEELRRGTDIFDPDTDRDGFIDGLEVQNGFDPTIPSPGDRVVFEQPLQSGVENDVDLGVATVQLVDVSTSPDFVDIRDKDNLTVLEDNSETDGTVRVASLDRGKKVVLEGVCIPNSFCNLYLYSDPVVVTVKTDALGRWTYELDKELDEGVHEAYVAITDNNGRVVEKSRPFSFVKTAQAIAVLNTTATDEDRFRAIVDRGFTFQDFAVLTLIVIIVAIILGLLILVVIARKARPLT